MWIAIINRSKKIPGFHLVSFAYFLVDSYILSIHRLLKSSNSLISSFSFSSDRESYDDHRSFLAFSIVIQKRIQFSFFCYQRNLVKTILVKVFSPRKAYCLFSLSLKFCKLSSMLNFTHTFFQLCFSNPT